MNSHNLKPETAQMATFDAHEYTITIKRVVEDGDRLFFGSVRELPNLATYERTYRRAYDLLIEAIEALHKEAEREGRPFPSPAEVQSEFSGRITLRLSPSLHGRVAQMADNDGVSLNTFIVAVLAEQAGRASSQASTLTFPDMVVANTDAFQAAAGAFSRLVGTITMLDPSASNVGVWDPLAHSSGGLFVTPATAPNVREDRPFGGRAAKTVSTGRARR